ncbi:MAG TPA: condensation domain-containing protein, partial [Acidobacteriaceae bacterium]|nr:condensation domain-containing protein [Acidobacteriaceae bacterium]
YSTSGYEPPVGEIEEKLAEVWAEVLKLDKVGRQDNFFSLGGHSLLAVTLIERMRRNGFTVDVRTLFATSTLAALAATVDADAAVVEVPPNRIPDGCEAITPAMLPLVVLTQEEIDKIVESVPHGASNVQDIYPLAPLQEGILFHHLMGGDGDPYLLAVQYSFDNRTRLEGYIGALQAVIGRHDILRTAVLWEGLPDPVQVVWRQATLYVEEIELDPAAGDAAEQLYARFDPRHFRIDVRQAPLLRLYIAYDREKDRWLIMQLLHHLAGDHSTLEVMQAEVQAELLGQQASLSAPLPFRNLVAQARLGVSKEEHEAFFRRMLEDVDEPTAPFGLVDVQGDGSGIEQARLTLDNNLARRLRASARRLGVSAASLCHLAWARVLAKVSGRQDVVFGTVLFGRMQGGEGADRVMGLFINTLPIRISVGEEDVESSARHTHALLADLLRHEHASLALAQRCSAVPAPAPLFSSLLNYRHIFGANEAPSEETIQAWQGIRGIRGEERTNYPFTLSVNDLGEGFSLDAQTLASVQPMRVCEFMRTALESLAEALETSPTISVRALEVLPASERHQLLYEWNDTRTDFPSDKCVHQLFEQQVAKSPKAIAVVLEDESLSYGELNTRANRLAHYLRKLGVR